MPNHNRTIGLCHGTFDFIHSGHIQHFQEAKSHCDYLIVSFTSNKVNRRKEKYFYTDEERMEHLRSISYIDEVKLVSTSDAVDVLKSIQPDFYFKGAEYADPSNDKNGRLKVEVEQLSAWNGKLILTSSNKVSSSSKLLKSRGFNPIEIIIDNQSKLNISEGLSRISSKSVNIIGETIIDEFVLGRHFGISPKSHCSVLGFNSTSEQLGGSAAIARHLSSFIGTINLYTNGFTKECDILKLPENVVVKRINDGDIRVTRYEDERDAKKLFELKINTLKETKIDFYGNENLTIISNFGLGLLSQETLELFQENAPRVLYMAQSNSSNHGLNRLNLFRNAFAYIADLREVGLLLGMTEEGVSNCEYFELAERIHKELNFEHFMLTRGSNGLLHFIFRDNTIQVVETPGCKVHDIIDTIGSGDAALSLFAVSLLMNSSIGDGDYGLLANLGGALCTQWKCNERFVSKQMIQRYI